MKKLFTIVLVAVSLFPHTGNALIDTTINTTNTILEGSDPYKKIEKENNAYKQDGVEYGNSLEADLIATFAGSVERTVSEDEMKYVLRKLKSKESFRLDDGKIFESLLARVYTNLKNEYLPIYNENYKTYAENFCKTQVAREEKINALIDETDALNVSAILGKTSKTVNGWANASTQAKWNDLTQKVTAFTKFNQKYGCAKYDSRAMGKGQSVNVLNDLRFTARTKGSQLSEMQNILRRFAVSKTSDRGMFANAFKYKMKNFLAQ